MGVKYYRCFEVAGGECEALDALGLDPGAFNFVEIDDLGPAVRDAAQAGRFDLKRVARVDYLMMPPRYRISQAD